MPGVARALYGHLLGVDLAEAEAIVEDARKIVWVTHFSGAPIQEVAELYSRSERALRLALPLVAYSLLEAEAVIGEMRFALYVNAFGRDPSSRFGSQFAAAAERAELDAGSAGETTH